MNVELYVDVLCPWCYIGKRRVEAALAELPDERRVEVSWRSYELGQEGTTPGPTAADELVAMWGDQAAARLARIVRLGAAEGLELNLHLARPVSTFDAHRLIQLGADRDLAGPVLERLLYAYHTEGRNIADARVLERLGGEAGLDAGAVRELLAGDGYAAAVRDDEQRAVDKGVRGVPALVIDGRPPVSAIQAPAELRRRLEEELAA